MKKIRSSKLIIHKDHLKHNIHAIQKLLKPHTEIMPVVKALGYGTHCNQLVQVFTEMNIKQLAVAITDEGVALRNAGYQGRIVILNQPHMEDIPTILQYKLTPCLSLLNFAKELNRQCALMGELYEIHIEIDTGMGRTGVPYNMLPDFIDNIQTLTSLLVEGISSHFASSDCDEDFTNEQIQRFDHCVSMAKQRFNSTLKFIHCCNSSGIINYPHAHYNLVRPGLILYGYYPNPEFIKNIDLKPTSIFQAKISFIKTVPTGTSVSYGRKFIAERPSVIATIPVGYHDGIPRLLTNNGYISIHGERAPIVGTVCMDSFMIDVTDIKTPVEIDDTAYIWDNKIVTLEEIAERCGTINYEILCTISERIPRLFIS